MIRTSVRLLIWIAFVGAIFVSGSFCTERASAFQSESPTIDESIQRSIDFLLSMQGDDGAWHSAHYGAMKQGAANTSLVLYALSHLPEEDVKTHRDSIDQARNFLLRGIEQKGCVANPEGSLDYPVYSTALILSVHKKLDLGLTKKQTNRMIEFLLNSQCQKRRGFERANSNHGGWDILGPGSTRGKTAGANVSVSFFVLEALTQFQGEIEPNSELAARLDESLKSAMSWCQRIQKRSEDGGFYFTSELNSTLNKAGWRDDKFRLPRAYGSATCDGLNIQLTLGENPNGENVRKSISWLVANPGIKSVPGFDGEADIIGWPTSLRFYYLSSLSRSLSVFEDQWTTDSKLAIAKLLTNSQLESGAWKNASSRMRENDELIATPFGLIALLNCKSQTATETPK